MKKHCPDCGIAMIEVRQALLGSDTISNAYPKDISEPNLSKTYHEYRFFCKKCKKEWSYDTRPHCRYFEKVPVTSQFKYSHSKGLLLLNKKNKSYKSNKQKLKKFFD